jgi:hypothetical protein
LFAAATVTSPIWIGIGAFFDQVPMEEARRFGDSASIEQAPTKNIAKAAEQIARDKVFMAASTKR